ncbi:adenine phosphoribosyltransferase [Aeromicrobium sp.]|uniref:adenine phosphoribosyltransferase n=1 Tax=Aeromicrobium sp. TaxID=1871063 RepID=UPI003C55C0D7
MSAEPDRAAALIERWVRPIPDWPAPGVTFRDITPLLAQPDAFAAVIDAMAAAGQDFGPIDAVLGIEARGFIVGAPVALKLGAGFVPVRKDGKLPAETLSVSYALEYGEATIEIHTDALKAGDRVLVVDDVLATGGTLAATATLVAEAGATVAGYLVAIELPALDGRSRLADTPLRSLASF